MFCAFPNTTLLNSDMTSPRTPFTGNSREPMIWSIQSDLYSSLVQKTNFLGPKWFIMITSCRQTEKVKEIVGSRLTYCYYITCYHHGIIYDLMMVIQPSDLITDIIKTMKSRVKILVSHRQLFLVADPTKYLSLSITKMMCIKSCNSTHCALSRNTIYICSDV